MDSPQQCVPTHCFLRLEPSIVQATSFHQQLPLWMCLPLTHPSSLFSLRRDFSPPPDFRTVRNCPEPLSMRRRTAFLRQGCRILYIVGVCVNRIGTPQSGLLGVAQLWMRLQGELWLHEQFSVRAASIYSTLFNCIPAQHRLRVWYSLAQNVREAPTFHSWPIPDTSHLANGILLASSCRACRDKQTRLAPPAARR